MLYNGSWVNEKRDKSSGDFRFTKTRALGSIDGWGVAWTLPVRNISKIRSKI
jgi:hypothetical protein